MHARRVQISVPPASAGVPACVIWGSLVKVTRILDEGYRVVYREWLQTGGPAPHPVSGPECTRRLSRFGRKWTDPAKRLIRCHTIGYKTRSRVPRTRGAGALK
ncbi:hypothetical protein D1006_05515 [Burkholderia stabilis]|uniref:Uncharacterized protein n=1 Tax=Burkholderia stabilis TaxID=95485 RepID=A0A4Q2ASD3_9BURK|nr:hypothetical protein D1006_05515 [Burkholderia stabilis]